METKNKKNKKAHTRSLSALEASATYSYLATSRPAQLVAQAKKSDNGIVKMGDAAVTQAFKLFSWGLNRTISPETVSSLDRKITALAGSAANVAQKCHPDNVFNMLDSALDTSFAELEEEVSTSSPSKKVVPEQPKHVPLVERPVLTVKKIFAFSSRASNQVLPQDFIKRLIAAKNALLSKDFLATIATLVLHFHDRLADLHERMASHQAYQLAAAKVPEKVSTKVSKFVSDTDQRVVQALRTVQAEGEDEQTNDEEEEEKTEKSETQIEKKIQTPVLVDPTPEQLELLMPEHASHTDGLDAKLAHDAKFAHPTKTKHLHQVHKTKARHEIKQPGGTHH